MGKYKVKEKNMGDPQNQCKDKPCEICGHVGYVDPLTICSKCKVTREHIYCMRVAYGGDPDEWVCEECDSSNQRPPSKPAPSKKPGGAGTRSTIKKPPKNSKVQYLTPEEAMVLGSGSMRSNFSSPRKSHGAHRSSMNKPTSSSLPPKFKSKPNPPVAPSGRRESLNNWSMPSCSKGISKGREAQRVTMVLDSYLPNHPAISPTWNGIFQFTRDEHCIFAEIQAHPPCKVHRKVYRLSKQLPKTLPFEMLPRRKFWVDIFADDVPGGLDIGLYFLCPESNLNGGSKSTSGQEQIYSSLLEHLDECDLLMRTRFDEVELLVFSSKHLSEDSCKINQKHFLWGLLRPSETNTVPSKAIMLAQNSKVQQPMSEEPEAEDMVVDMLGGQELGNSDVAVRKPTDNACGDPIKGEIQTSNKVKASPKSAGREEVEFPPIRIKKEWTDGDMEASLPYTPSCVADVLNFEKELQRSVDRFVALMQVKEAGCLKRDVKEEVK